jgi:hypothetical protein
LSPLPTRGQFSRAADTSGRAAWCGSRPGNDLEIDSNRRTKYQKTSVTSRCPALDPTSTTDRVQVPAYDAADRLLNHGDMSGLRYDEFGRLAPLLTSPRRWRQRGTSRTPTWSTISSGRGRQRPGAHPDLDPGPWTLDPQVRLRFSGDRGRS